MKSQTTNSKSMNHRQLRDEVVISRRCCGFMKTDAIPLGFGLNLGAVCKGCAWVLRRHMTVFCGLL